jgi:hypothetical protein
MICNWSDNRPPGNHHYCQERTETETGQVKRQGVHVEFIQGGATVNKHRYKEILHRLRNSVHHKHPELWRRKNWLFLHNNSPANRSVLVQEELTNQKVTVLPHPQHLSDLAPGVFSFPTWKKSYVGVDFSWLRRSPLPQGKLYETFLQIFFTSVSSSYTNIGRLA